MKLLARARGLQERIRPIMYLVSRGRLGNVRTVEGECEPTTRGREVLPVPNHYGIAPASKLSTREAGRFIREGSKGDKVMNKETIRFRLLSYTRIIKQEQGEVARIRARIAWFSWAMEHKN